MKNEIKFDCNTLIGLYLQEAAWLAGQSGFHIRILSEDGKEFIATRDYKRDRVSLRFIKGKVSEAKIG